MTLRSAPASEPLLVKNAAAVEVRRIGSVDVIAPKYPPALAYNAPVGAAYEFGIDTVSLSELFANPATRAVLKKEAPFLLGLEKIEAIGFHKSNFTIPELAFFSPIGTPAMFARIDAGLRAIPASERPQNGW